jgi:deoxyribonuclease V
MLAASPAASPERFVSQRMTIAFVDVSYDGPSARAACVLAQSWEAEAPLETHVRDISHVEPYEPGKFHRRELPCLLSVLRLLQVRPDVVVIDGYVWLSSPERPGLGARLHEALGSGAAVVGIAKTAFAGAAASAVVAKVCRGGSVNPVYVTAAGIDLAIAAERVRRMAGKHRIPDLARMADRLARTKAGFADNVVRSTARTDP